MAPVPLPLLGGSWTVPGMKGVAPVPSLGGSCTVPGTKGVAPVPLHGDSQSRQMLPEAPGLPQVLREKKKNQTFPSLLLQVECYHLHYFLNFLPRIADTNHFMNHLHEFK